MNIIIKLTIMWGFYRKPLSRAVQESYPFPPPATVFGSLMSFLGEMDPLKYLPCSIGIAYTVANKATVLYTQHKFKTVGIPIGTESNKRPMLRDILSFQEVYIILDSESQLCKDVLKYLDKPTQDRLGSWSMGESHNLINSIDIVTEIPLHAEKLVIDTRGEYVVCMNINPKRENGLGKNQLNLSSRLRDEPCQLQLYP
jgi:CRISPR-associated protein Cas5t